MAERRLNPGDAFWFYSEEEKNPQTVSCLLWMDREIDPDQFRAIISERLVDKYPIFHQRIRRSRNPLMLPHWKDDPDFNLDNHVEVVQLPAPGDKAALADLVSAQRSTQLDLTRPLWKFFLIQGYEGKSAIHARIQHSIADGWALVRLVLSLADESDQNPAPKVIDKKRKRKRDLAARATDPVTDAVTGAISATKASVARAVDSVTETAGRVVGGTRAAVSDPGSIPARLAEGQDALEQTVQINLDPSRFAEFGSQMADQILDQLRPVTETASMIGDGAGEAVGVIYAPRPGRTILHGKVSGVKRVDWIDPVPLEPIKAAGKAYGATVNDMLMAALTNALRLYLEEKDALTVDSLLTTVPISLRKPTAALPRTLGNRFGILSVLLPVGIADPVEQLQAIKTQMDEIKGSLEPIVSFGVVGLSALLTPEVQRRVARFSQAQAIGVTTNVPGPRHELTLAGGVVKGAWGMGGVAGDTNLSFGIFTLNGELNFSVHCDVAITPDPERILAHFLTAVNTLVERAPA